MIIPMPISSSSAIFCWIIFSPGFSLFSIIKSLIFLYAWFPRIFFDDLMFVKKMGLLFTFSMLSYQAYSLFCFFTKNCIYDSSVMFNTDINFGSEASCIAKQQYI